MDDEPRIVGALGAPAVGHLDATGRVELDDVTLEWRVGAEDHWHDPHRDAGVRQDRLTPAPAYETRVRIPSGDAVQRVYGAPGRDGGAYVVVDVENASPAPFALALVLRAKPARRATSISLDRSTVVVGDRPALVLPKPPMRWATAEGATGTAEIVTSGAAREGPFETVRAPGAEAAFIFPVAHRTSVRVALALDRRVEPSPDVLEQLPPLDAVQRGWLAQLDRAMRVEIPGALQPRVDAARATLLLQAGTNRPDARTMVDLEDWGFDDEVAAAWHRAKTKERRVAAHRTAGAGNVLEEVRDVLLRDRGDEVALLPGFPDDWVGQSVTVHDAPTRAGRVSFAVRWHGERPALLWDAPANLTLRAPVLDPSWSVAGGEGEALLAPWKPA
ncbi:MAG: hypothetical protein JWL83_1375 [Actinomycetia bacterium]|nr:hypothetical protein [Actinomycetes bacterium]